MASPGQIADALLGAAYCGVTLVFSPLLRPWYNRWGATPEEVARPLPYDAQVPRPQQTYTHAITIHAPPSAVWPWLVQIGWGKGGMYSYDLLENIAGCQMHSADRIVPEYQHLQIGDAVRLGPPGYPMNKVMGIEPNQALILQGADPKTGDTYHLTDNPPEDFVNGSWVFFLEAPQPGVTRLLVRSRIDYRPTFLNRLIWRFITEPLNFVMERKMLLNLKAQAEALAEPQRRFA
jgi:hypothetical protein